MRDYYTGFLHAHKFGAKKYDCVWITWVLMYLSDSEIFTLFTRIRAALREDLAATEKEEIEVIIRHIDLKL